MQPDILSQEFEHEIVEVSPETAERWLKSQFEGQRRLRDHHVYLLAQEMESGTFIPHSSIVFADHGGKSYLIDGQHRLQAITLYGKPVKMPVLRRRAESLKEVGEWYSSIDQGLKRSAGDAIRAQGLASELSLTERQTARLSGAVRQIATGFLDATAGLGSAKKARVRARSNAYVSALMRRWSTEAQTYFSIIQGGEQSNYYLFERASVMACALLTLRYVPEKAKEFWGGAARDDGLARHDPRKRFLVWLRENKEKPSDIARGFDVVWRVFLDGGEVKLVRIDSTKPVDIRFVPLENETAEAAQLDGENTVLAVDIQSAEAPRNAALTTSLANRQTREPRTGEAGVHTQPLA